jgi:hypothetical protein
MALDTGAVLVNFSILKYKNGIKKNKREISSPTKE